MAIGLRPAILRALADGEATVSQLAERLGRPPGTVGHHLKVLQDAGLIRISRTEQVRAITAKFYVLAEPAEEDDASFVVLQARLSEGGLREWMRRSAELASELSNAAGTSGQGVTLAVGVVARASDQA